MSSDDAKATTPGAASSDPDESLSGEVSDASEAPVDGHGADIEPAAPVASDAESTDDTESTDDVEATDDVADSERDDDPDGGRSIWGTSDEDEGYAYVRRSDPNWDLSKWLIVCAVAAVFILLSFILIPNIFSPADEAAPSSSVAAPPPASTTAAPAPDKAYKDVVLASGPTHYWQFAYGADPSTDALATSNLTLGKDVSVLGSSAISGDSGAIDCAATSRSTVNSQTEETPTGDFTLEAWVNTTASDGGQVLSFGSSASGSSSKVDRTLYIDASGLAYIGTRVGSKRYAAQSETTVTDGNWHHLVGTMSTASGLTLYVDGQPVATEPKGNAVEEFSGYWRICGDSLSGWPAASKVALTGSVDEVAVYNKALAADEVLAHFQAAS